MKKSPQIRVTRYIFSSFITNLILGGSGFLLSVIYARALGPEGKGYITAIFLWPIVLVSICALGYEHANIYQASNKRVSASKLVTNTFLMFIAVTPFALIIGWLGLPIFFESANTALWQTSKIALIAVPLLLLQVTLSGLLIGWQKIDYRNFIRIMEKVALLLVIIVLIFLDNITLTTIVASWITISSLTTVIAIFFVFKDRKIEFIRDGKLFIQTIKYGLKSYLGAISEWGSLRIDQLFMAALFTAAGLGIYSVAVAMTESLWLLAFAISMVVFPATSALKADDAINLTAKASRVTLIMLSGLGIIIFFMAPTLVNFLFGPKFLTAELLIKILIPGTIAYGVGSVIGSGLMGINQPLKASIAQAAALVSTILLAPPLIIFYGAVGAAIASNIAYGIYFSIGLYYFLSSCELSLKEILVVRKSDFDIIQRILQAIIKKRGYLEK